jgi:probable rRNA maturation factor
MIYLDPDLDPKPAAGLQAAIAPLGSKPTRSLWADRIPTRQTLQRFLAEAQVAVRLRGEVSVLVTTDRRIRQLNREFRGKNQATDVLSFPADEFIRKLEGIAGDLAIGIDTARKQARAQNHALTCELKVLILHGLLHLAGYDHETDSGQMARRERLLRAKLKLPLGLIERAAGASRREATKVARGGVRASERNPGKAAPKPPRRPVGPARKAAIKRSHP